MFVVDGWWCRGLRYAGTPRGGWEGLMGEVGDNFGEGMGWEEFVDWLVLVIICCEGVVGVGLVGVEFYGSGEVDDDGVVEY